MRPFPGTVLLGGLAVLLAADAPASAAWNNVFQVSCFRSRRTTSAYVPACCPPTVVAAASPCPEPCAPQCTTSYVQRSYYQPVTSYQQKTYYEPVTTMQTSYYYESVCSYRYSCYYDPCTCSYQQVATPVTSYRLRSRCNPVTSYLQRTQCVPVTSYQLSYYYEPVTTCCRTTVGAPVNVLPPGAAPVKPAPATPGLGERQTPIPGVGEQPRPGAGGRPGVSEDPTNTESYRYPPETRQPPMTGAHDSSYRQPRLRSPELPTPAGPVQQSAPPKVRLDRIVMLKGHTVEGQVVRSTDQKPHSNVRLLFVNADQDDSQHSVTADGEGRFQTSLAKGNWLVYVRNREGTPVYQKRIVVKDSNRIPVVLTSR